MFILQAEKRRALTQGDAGAAEAALGDEDAAQAAERAQVGRYSCSTACSTVVETYPEQLWSACLGLLFGLCPAAGAWKRLSSGMALAPPLQLIGSHRLVLGYFLAVCTDTCMDAVRDV